MYSSSSTVRVIFFMFALLGTYALVLTLHYKPTFSLTEPAAVSMGLSIGSALILAFFKKGKLMPNAVYVSLGTSVIILLWIIFIQDFERQDTYIHKLVMLTMFINAISVCLVRIKR